MDRYTSVNEGFPNVSKGSYPGNILNRKCELNHISRLFRSLKYLLAPQVLFFVTRIMICRASIVLMAVLSLSILSDAQSSPPGSNAGSQEQPKSDPKPSAAPKGQISSMTGCVDEQDGQWVLINDQNMAVMANLAAEGFPTEGFAKHMGHKVTVRGIASSGATRPVFKVRTIVTVSETCSAR